MRAAAVFLRTHWGLYTGRVRLGRTPWLQNCKLLEEAQWGLFLTLVKPSEGWVVVRKSLVVYLGLVVHIDV